MNKGSIAKRALGKVLGLKVAACALAACAGDGSSVQDVGVLQVALTAPPADAVCLRLTLDFAGGQPKLAKTQALVANTPTTLTLPNLPLGEVGIVAEAFSVTCPNLTAASPLTWVADRGSITLAPDFTPTFNVTLRRAGRLNVGVDFAAGATFEEVKLPAPAAKLTPSGTNILMSVPNISAVWSASNAFDAKQVVAVPGQPRYLAAASDGTILVTTAGPTALLAFTSAGVAKSTTALPFVAGDLLLDSANTAWVGSSSSAQIARIATATTTPSSMVFPLPGMTAPGLALASDGTIYIANQPGAILTMPAVGGGVLSQVSVPVAPRDLIVAADGTVWFTSTSAATGLFKLPPGGSAQSVFVAASEGSIINTPKGVVASMANGTLLLVQPAGAVQLIQLPDGASAGGLALASTGKVWVADLNKPRALIVTLP